MIGLNLSGFSNVEEEYRRQVDPKVLCSQESREGPPRDGAHCTSAHAASAKCDFNERLQRPRSRPKDRTLGLCFSCPKCYVTSALGTLVHLVHLVHFGVCNSCPPSVM